MSRKGIYLIFAYVLPLGLIAASINIAGLEKPHIYTIGLITVLANIVGYVEGRLHDKR